MVVTCVFKEVLQVKYENNAEINDKFKRNEERETKRTEESTKKTQIERGGGEKFDMLEFHNHGELHFYCRKTGKE